MVAGCLIPYLIIGKTLIVENAPSKTGCHLSRQHFFGIAVANLDPIAIARICNGSIGIVGV